MKRDGWQIVIGKEADIVEHTASAEMASFFKDVLGKRATVCRETAEDTKGKRIVLGTVGTNPAIRSAQEKGFFRELDAAGTKDDAFEIAVKGNAIYIAGQNPRGVLYGTYYLGEYVRRNAKRFPADRWHIYKKPAFRGRLTVSYNSLDHVFNEEDVRYASRLGFNEMIINWWALPLGDWGMAGWADSSVFPSLKEPKYIKIIKNFLKIARKYGIEGVFSFCEPQPILRLYGKDVVERLGGKGLLGYQPDIPHGSLQTTCVNSPKIQEHYRSMMVNLMRDFPEVSKLLIYEDDGDFWHCHPDHCARCKASLKKTKPPYGKFSWELTTSFINLLQAAARQVRPDFQVMGSSYHYLNCMPEYLGNLTEGAGAITPVHNMDAWIYISITKKMQDFLRPLVSVADAKDVTFGVVDEFTQSEKFGFAPACPWPYATYRKLRAYSRVGVKYLQNFSTPIPNAQSINPIVFKEFLWDPNRGEETMLRQIAKEQFGEKAGKKMREAWIEMRKTFETYAKPGTPFWSTYLMTGTLCTSFGMFRPLTITGLRTNPDQYYKDHPDPKIIRTYFKKEFRNKDSLAQMEEACSHIRKAVAHSKEAIALAPEDKIPFYAYYYFPRRKITCREYAEEQYHSLNFNRYIFESNLNFLKAELLVRENRDDEARTVISRENKNTEEILRTSAAYLSGKLGLLHDAAGRVTPYKVLKGRHPAIQKLRQKLV